MRARARSPFVLGIWSAMLLGCCAFALDPSLDISQYAHTSWKVRDGFTKGAIYAIAQTPDGYLWLGTELGLYRFDGVRAIPWQPPAGQQLPSNFIFSMLAAHDGTLWIGTLKGLASWKDGKLTNHLDLAGLATVSLLEDRQRSIWIGARGSPTGRLCRVTNDTINCFGEDGSLGSGVTDLYEDSKGNLWVGVVNGFWRWKPGVSKFYSMPDAPEGIRAFSEDDNGTLLFETLRGLRRFANGTPKSYPVPMPQAHVARVLRDHDGGLWIGTATRGIIHVYRGKINSLGESDGLASDNILHIFEDREGDVWVASDGGIDRFRSYAISTITTKQGLSSNVVWSVLADQQTVWAGTLNGLNQISEGRVTRFGSDGKLNGETADFLFKDSIGRFWASTLHDFGFLRNGHFFAIRDWPGGHVHCVIEDRPGSLWIANQDLGLFHLSDSTVVRHIPWAGLGHDDDASAIVADPLRGGLWIGFRDGTLTYIRATYTVSNRLGEGHLNSLKLDRDGTLWVATEGGLSRLNNGSISTMTTKNGLPCDSVHWMTKDDDQTAWLYMPCGLVRIPHPELAAWITDSKRTIRTTVFDSSDGVSVRALAEGYGPKVTKSSDGKLWFATHFGVSVIDPHHLAFNKVPPPVDIEQIIADRKSYQAEGNLRLQSRVRDLEIDYTALSLVAPEKNRFRYKLEGRDRDWQDVGNRRTAFYTDLPPRNYRFRVIASNNSGVWNEQGATLDFVIPPAWYQTNWFRALCVAVFLALMWTLHQVRLHQQARQFNMTLEARVGERTRIARELHDTLLQSFHGLLLQFRAASQLVQPHSQAKQILDTAIERAADAIAESRKTVQGLRTSTVEGRDLGKAIRTVGEELAAANSGGEAITFQVQGVGPRRDLRALVHDEVYRIAIEALRNAFQHAGAKRITVEIEYEPREFQLRFSDDGRGIDAHVLQSEGLKGHFGLPGMRERATIIGGKLDVWSSVGEGTEISLTIPGAKAYSGANGGPWWSRKFSRKEKEQGSAAGM